ncbi:MAG: replication-relaxation family protein, partial [Actinomycetota bacterium]
SDRDRYMEGPEQKSKLNLRKKMLAGPSPTPTPKLPSAKGRCHEVSFRWSYRFQIADAFPLVRCTSAVAFRHDILHLFGGCMTRGVGKKQLQQLRESATAFEWSVLKALAIVRVANTRQLRDHVFPELKKSNAGRNITRLLKKMESKRLVLRLQREVGGPHGGARQSVWALDTAGTALTHDYDELPRRPRTPGPMFLKHAQAVSEIFFQLAELERCGRLQIRSFEAEPSSWRHFFSAVGPTALKPDAYAEYVVGERTLRAVFLEADLDTEAKSTVAKKMSVFAAYYESGLEQERLGMFPRVIFIAPNAKRYQAIVDVAADQPTEYWPLFTVCLYEDIIKVLVPEVGS